MKTIRIAHLVNPTFGSVFSGHTHYLFTLLSGWTDKDISLDLLGTQIKPLNMNSGDPVYCLPEGSFWSSPKRQDRWDRIRWSFRQLRILINFNKKYDIIHFHSLNWGSLISPLILHPMKKKVVFTMSLFGNDNPSYLSQQPRGGLQVALLRKFDGAIGLSPALVEDAKANGLHNVICLPNFLAIPQLEENLNEISLQQRRTVARIKFDFPQNARILLFVGSIIHRKGVDVLVDAFIKLASKYPDLLLVLVGPQSKSETNSINEEYVIQLKESIESSGYKDRVIWVGMVREQSTLVEYYRSADIFVLPTRNEGSPNVLAEAMAANLPVVISMLPGITDSIISTEESGCLVKPDDTVGFTLALDELLRDEDKRNAMGKAGRKIAMEKFSFDSYCQKLKCFYLDLVVHQPHG